MFFPFHFLPLISSQIWALTRSGPDRLTRGIRRWSWRRNSTSIVTSREEGESKLPMPWDSLKDRSKFGFKTGKYEALIRCALLIDF